MNRRNLPKLPVYLDYQATTPTDPRVVEAMLPYFTEKFGNPHSASHQHGREAAVAIEQARAQVADLIGADAKEIIFTSGATEANNLALKGVFHFLGNRRRHLITCATEHKCVLESARHLASEGVDVTLLPVGHDGLIDLDRLSAAISERTALVSIMAAHNETGVIQPIAEIGALCRAKGALFHTDAAQAVGKIVLDVEAMNIDLLSISGHKVYGPKGVGALYVRRRPRVRLAPIIDGGGQERGLRSGTLPTPLCVGLGAACAIAKVEMADEGARILLLRRRLYDRLRSGLGEIILNGSAERRLAGNLNVGFPVADGQAFLAEVPDLSLSLGSACTSAAVEPSYVLRAMGVPDAVANASIRVGLGRFTTEGEIDFAAEQLVAAAGRLRETAGRRSAG
ncbi:MAG: aminotransferase class V-fold PLP-dependent enzyme [Dongiaceae bacterium]